MQPLKGLSLFTLIFLFVTLTGFSASQTTSRINFQSISQNKGGDDLVFANGFEVGTPPVPTYTSDTISSISEVPSVEVGSELVGSIGGGFQSDQMGQANYSIPILTGAATAGLAPQISLNYSSGSGNGIAGVGWSLSGTTIITRCRETQESRDGSSEITPQPITWDNNDKLCLNGERLYLVSGANYWAEGSIYRTERDQFARITYTLATDTFTIQRKDGSIANYGDTTDSAIQATDVAGSPTYAWAISRFTDNMGNYIDYTYQKFGDLEFALLDVDYTGHLANPVLAPYNNISFTYEDIRTDKTTAYIAGAKVSMTRRLASIDSLIDGTSVRTYTLAYDNSTHSSRSILTAISECRGASCLPITTFDWSQPNVAFKTTTPAAGNFPTGLKSSKLGDINGDGRADLIFVDDNTNTFKVALANGSSGFNLGTTTTISAPTGTQIDNKWHLLDFNADGRQDLLKQVGSSWFVYLALAGSIGFSSTSTASGIPASTSNSDFQIVDMNGDGLADLLYDDNLQLQVRYLLKTAGNYGFSSTLIRVDLPSNPSQISGMPVPACPPSSFCINQMRYRFYTNDELNIRAQDVNGDGVADLVLRSDVYQSTLANALSLAEDPTYLFISTGQEASDVPIIQGEEVTVHKSSHWVAFIGKGVNNSGDLDYSTQKLYISQASSLFESADDNIRFIDINADGLTDVLSKGSSGDFWDYALGTGAGFTTLTQLGTINNQDHLQLFDHNGDGYIDLYYPSSTSDNPYYLRTWTGNGFSGASLQTAKAINFTSNVNLFLDLNGDGREDHLRIDSSGNQKIYIREDSHAAVDKITQITNGLDAKTSVTYKPVTFSSTYSQGTNANLLNYGNNSPVFDYLSSMYVVSTVTTDTPTQINANATTTMSYQYKDARVQTGGRGFLGFGEIITSVPVKASTQSQNYLLQTQTTYHQEFPFIGLPKSVTVNQFEVAPTPPPVCVGDDSCFPPPCYPGQICEIIQKSLKGSAVPVLLSETINSFDKATTVGKAQFAYIDSTIEKTYAPNGTGLLKTRVQTTAHDNFGNPTANTVKIYDGAYNPGSPTTNLLHTTTTTNLYDNLTTNWKIGLLRSTSSTVSRPGKPSVTNLMQYDYNNTTGLLSEERRLSNDGADKFLRVLHEYDNFGNEDKTISCSGDDFTTAQCANTTTLASDLPDSVNPTKIHRYNQLVFDAKGRYVNQVKNSLGQTVSTITSRDIYGNPKTTTDLLSTTTTNTYDVFGTAQTSYSSLGSWTYASKKWCADIIGTSAETCPSDAKIRITNKASGGLLSYSFIDKLGRTISTTGRSFNAIDDTSTVNPDERWIINDQYYDNLGRAVTTVGPYFYGETDTAKIPGTTTEYDRYNRVTKVTLPDGATESVDYTGFVTTTTNALNQSKIETKNSLGELIQSQDHLGSKLNYTYNAQGLVTEIKRTADGSTELLIKNTYDKTGRKTKSEDVDTATTLSDFNAEGEIIKVTDAKGQYVRTYRDELGRVELTENFDASNTKKLSTSQNYNTATNQIESEVELLGVDAFRRDYVYDTNKRLTSITTNFTDTQNVCNNGGDCEYTNSLYYDKYSRSKIEQDASGKAIKNNYNTQGYLERITNAENESQQYYKINSTDNRGNITQDTKATNLVTDYSFDANRGFMTNIVNNSLSKNIWYNYSYDQLGNLKKRADIKDINNTNMGMSECFYYDDLNRLTDTRRYANFGINCGSQPAGTTKITSMVYNGKGNITHKDGQPYTYLNANTATIGSSPHQVKQKGSQVFTYDANGNNTKMTNFQSENGSFQNRNIDYNTFNKVDRLWLGNDPNNPISEAKYKYDTTRQKFARIDTEGSTSKVTYFIGNVEIEYNGSSVKYKRQLGNYAILTETGTTTIQAYLFTDHLGSIDTIADENGTILQQMSFSAWGERRLPTDWQDITLPTLRQQMDQYTNRGYTGHEMVDAFGIINMGGRLYDADLGRVLQADPFVQDPTNTQSFNRYTYVFNNPLSYTDPSGYFSLRQVIGIAVGIALAIFLPGSIGVFWTGFISGFASSLIITGNLKTALISGIIAGSIAFVGDKIFSNRLTENVDSKTVNKPPDPGASLDTVKPIQQFKDIPAPNIPDATGAAINDVVQSSGFNSSNAVNTGISSADDVVVLDNVVVKARLGANGRYINDIPRFVVSREAIIAGFASGISSLLLSKWSGEFINHTVNNAFSDLDSLGQNIADNRIANELIDLQTIAIRSEVVKQWYATTSFNISIGLIAPLSMSEGAIAAGVTAKQIVSSIGNVARRQILKLNANRALKESLVDGIGEALGTPSLESAFATVSRSEAIKILIKTKAADSIKRAVDLIPR